MKGSGWRKKNVVKPFQRWNFEKLQVIHRPKQCATLKMFPVDIFERRTSNIPFLGFAKACNFAMQAIQALEFWNFAGYSIKQTILQKNISFSKQPIEAMKFFNLLLRLSRFAKFQVII